MTREEVLEMDIIDSIVELFKRIEAVETVKLREGDAFFHYDVDYGLNEAFESLNDRITSLEVRR